MLVIAGSARTQATSPSASARVERFDVVPLDRLRRFRQVNRRADVVGARAGLAVDLDRERLVDGAVVAPGVDEDLRPAGDRPGEADHGAVGVGGGQRELPVGEAKAASELLADPARVLGGEHQGDAADCLGGDRLGRCGGRMPGHRAGVAQAEVDVGVVVHVGEVGARRLGHEHRVRAGPLRHPRHRHAGKERLLPLLEELPGARVLLDEALLLGSQEPAAAARDPSPSSCGQHMPPPPAFHRAMTSADRSGLPCS